MKYLLILQCILLSSLWSQEVGDTGPRTALVIVDMQPYFIKRKKYHLDRINKIKVESILRSQIEAVSLAKEYSIPVFAVQYDHCEIDETHPLLIEAIGDYEKYELLWKTTSSLFANDNEHKESVERSLLGRFDTLVIMGANGGACVENTIKSALKKNFKVVAYSKGTADFNYPNFLYPYMAHLVYLEHRQGDSFVELHSLPEINLIFQNGFLSQPEMRKRLSAEDCHLWVLDGSGRD